MGKGNIKFGRKSGVLPEVRQIFKNPIKPVTRPTSPNTGYAKGILHPKGTSRSQPPPKVQSVSKLIEKTVQTPKKIPDLKQLVDSQKEKAVKAALRRDYYVKSLRNEEQRLLNEEKRKKYLAEKESKRKAEEVHEISQATRLTLPTIDKLLEGPFMRDRTEEETQLLQAKRKANRLYNELTGKSNRAVTLLELFYKSKNFITNEAELASAIEKAFAADGNQQLISHNPETTVRSRNNLLEDALFDEINGKPGLTAVEEQLSGRSSAFDELVAKAVSEQDKRDLDNARRA